MAGKRGPRIPDLTSSRPRVLLALMASPKAMHSDVFPTLTHQMQAFSVQCQPPSPAAARTGRIRTTAPVYLNNALSAFEKALPFIQDLNVMIELEYDHHLHYNLQRMLKSYIRHTCSLLSGVDSTHKFKELKPNVRLHMDKISMQTSDTGKRTDIRTNPTNRCPSHLYSNSGRNVKRWTDSNARTAGVFMAQAIVPFREIAESGNFLGDSHHVMLCDRSYRAHNLLQNPAWRPWDMVMKTYFGNLRGLKLRDQKGADRDMGTVV